jgi:metallopeptidase MepB
MIEKSMKYVLSEWSPDKAIQDVATAAEKLWRDYEAEMKFKPEIISFYDAVLKRNERLDAESRKLLEALWKDYTRSGHGLLEDQQIGQYLKTKKKC